MAWTLVQDVFADFQYFATLPSTPTTGNVVVVGTFFRDTVNNVDVGTHSCADGNNVDYVEVPSSPSVKINRGTVMLFYHLVVGGESPYVETHITNGTDGNVSSHYIAEFAPPGGATPSFDGSTQANGTAAAGTFSISSGQATAGSMVVPCAGSDDLFVNILVGNPATPGAVSPWVRFPSDPGGENPGMAYALTGGGPKTISWTGTSQIDFSVVGVSFKVPSSGNTAALTGSAGTASQGSATAAFSGLTPTGKSATGTAGAETPGTSVPLTGKVGTTAVGSAAPSDAIALPGQSSAIGSVGSVSVNGSITLPITGVSSTGSVGTESAYKGIVIGFTRAGMLAASGGTNTFALVGLGSVPALGTIQASGGNVSALLTGQQVVGSAGRATVSGSLLGQALTSTLNSLAAVSVLHGVTTALGTGQAGTVVGHPSPGPQLLSVAADDPPTSKSIVFNWQADPTPGVTDYHVEVGTAPGQVDAGVFDVGSTATTYVAVLPNGLYYTRIRSFIGASPSGVSPDVVVVVSGRTGLVAVSLNKGLTGGVQAFGQAGPVAAQNNVAASLGGKVGTTAIGSIVAGSQVDVTVTAVGVAIIAVQGTLTSGFAPALSGSSLSTGVASVLPQSASSISGFGVVSTLGVVGASISSFVSVGLTSVVSTSAIGIEVPNSADLAIGLTGSAASGSVGSEGVSTGGNVVGPISGARGITAIGSVTPSTPPTTVGLTGASITGNIGTIGVNVTSSTSIALVGLPATSTIGSQSPTRAVGLAGQEIAILEAAIIGGLALNTIPLHALLGQIDNGLSIGLSSFQIGGSLGIMNRTIPVPEEDWICIIDEDDWTVVIR